MSFAREKLVQTTNLTKYPFPKMLFSGLEKLEMQQKLEKSYPWEQLIYV